MGKKHITDVEYLASDTSENPRCPHGPTLLFKRLVEGVEKSFYACSACRDRKDCNFFLWADEKLTPAKKQYLKKQHNSPQIDHADLYKLFLLVKEQISSRRAFCHTCSCLCLKSKVSENHPEHDVKMDISDYYLNHPSELLRPLENAKKEAQYLFSSSATKVIVNMVKKLGIKKHQFNDLEHFCWFNSFNNFFFSEDGPCVLEKFLESGRQNTVLIMDPPFGGRVEPLANTIKEITKIHKKVCPDITNDMPASCPDYTMLDYKVNYDNHPLFASGPKGRKHGSPVRIFTNASQEDIALPEEEGYRYCEICCRMVERIYTVTNLGHRASKISAKQNFRKDAQALLPKGKLKLRKNKHLFNTGRVTKKKEKAASKRRKRLSIP
ncbi:Zinc finger CCHC domain-containing protein 4 [Blattella germanica]|nr:Zinc finger CCHC domain-containing protein 4 [Blattella germanica]